MRCCRDRLSHRPWVMSLHSRIHDLHFLSNRFVAIVIRRRSPHWILQSSIQVLRRYIQLRYAILLSFGHLLFWHSRCTDRHFPSCHRDSERTATTLAGDMLFSTILRDSGHALAESPTIVRCMLWFPIASERSTSSSSRVITSL